MPMLYTFHMISSFFEWFLEKQLPCNAGESNILITCIFEDNLSDKNYTLWHSVILLEQSTVNTKDLKNTESGIL